MQDAQRHRRWFMAIWIAATVIKVVIAARLPLFVDEAFYWQESQHLAWAYSDLPGLSAWLARAGVELGGQHVLALRAPFLLLAANACARVVLPRPGRSSISRWPPESRATKASRTS